MIATRRIRRTAWLLLAVSGSLLLGALAFQFFGGLKPCEICYWQRYAHLAVMAVAALTLLAPRPAFGWATVLAMGIASGLGGYHTGVEQHWWRSATACAAPVAPGMTPDAMFAALARAPLVRCDEIPWSLFGISMAGWNALISAAACFAAILLLLSRRRNP